MVPGLRGSSADCMFGKVCLTRNEFDLDSNFVRTTPRNCPLTKADFQSLPLKSVKTIEVVEFVDESQIDMRCYTCHYFLASDEGGYKAYKLFVQAMAEAKLVAVASSLTAKRNARAK